MDDKIVISKIKNGDIGVFEFLFETHYVKLTLFANRFLNDTAVSEEIVSEAFTCLWVKRSTLIINTSVTSYLYRMVQNMSLNYLKRRKIESAYINYLIRNDFTDAIPKHDINPYLQKELAEQIKIAIESLPEKCQEIFKMSRYQHLKNREIAQKLNLSQKTVERQITIALEKMRNNLKYLLGVIFSILMH